MNTPVDAAKPSKKKVHFYTDAQFLSKAPEYRKMRITQWDLACGFIDYFKVRWLLHCSTPLKNSLLLEGSKGKGIVAIISFQNHIDGSRHAVAQIPLTTMRRLLASEAKE